MKKSEFLCMVQNELDTIKTKATKEELEELDINTFNHNSSYSCIYGQMTGNCDSDRAKQLYPKKFYKVANSISNETYYIPLTKQIFVSGVMYTPLEKYLFMVKTPQHKKLIQYLKNEIETIKL